MELSAFAEQILFSEGLAAKLHQPDRLTDERRLERVAVPPAPARPAGLRLPPRGRHERAAYPADGALVEPSARATVLHFFANHELLALELMALALLRFPEAPVRFRRGLAATMLEEQKHFQLYVTRLEELGLAFGAVPVNRYFWDAMAGTESPLTFVTQMALTFEQANLDYSRYYAELFARLGDPVTAALMDLVYREEIGHVRHGLSWFEHWRPAGEPAWVAYQRLLPAPLTPHRAKGKLFYREPRQEAGLDPEFIEELARYRQAPGRTAALYSFNPSFEEELLHGAKPPRPPAAVQAMTADLASVMLLLAGPDDLCLLPRAPSAAFMAELSEAGFILPRVVVSGSPLPESLLKELRPWGVSPAAVAAASALGCSWQKPPVTTPRELCSKAWAKAVLQSALPRFDAGVVCRSESEVKAALAARNEGAVSPMLLKAVFGSAGRHQHRLAPGAKLSLPQEAWVRAKLAEHGAIIVEPWRQRIADFSLQLRIGSPGRVNLGITRFLTTERGQYLGHCLGAKFADLPPEVVRAYHELRVPARLEEMGMVVAAALVAAGYQGPAGMDALLYKTEEGYELYPLVEVNTRHTMGAVALALDNKVHPRAPARWLHVTRRKAEQAGFDNFAELASHLRVSVPHERKAGLLVSAALATNDPEQATQCLSLLLVGDKALTIAAALQS